MYLVKFFKKTQKELENMENDNILIGQTVFFPKICVTSTAT